MMRGEGPFIAKAAAAVTEERSGMFLHVDRLRIARSVVAGAGIFGRSFERSISLADK
jgi:hypothetical protein